jgi:hypothetical protein
MPEVGGELLLLGLAAFALVQAGIIIYLKGLVRLWKARSAEEAEIKAREIETKAYLEKLEKKIEGHIEYHI